MSNYYISFEEKQGHYISHHGILGQKWGVRRYQNKDGTRTEAGKRRYSWLQDKLGYDERDALVEARRAHNDALTKQTWADRNFRTADERFQSHVRTTSKTVKESQAKAHEARELWERYNKAADTVFEAMSVMTSASPRATAASIDSMSRSINSLIEEADSIAYDAKLTTEEAEELAKKKKELDRSYAALLSHRQALATALDNANAKVVESGKAVTAASEAYQKTPLAKVEAFFARVKRLGQSKGGTTFLTSFNKAASSSLASILNKRT